MYKRGFLSTPSPSDVEGQAALEAALRGEIAVWENYLAKNPHRDGFSLLYSSSDEVLQRRLRNQRGGRENTDWLFDIDETVSYRSRLPDVGLAHVNKVLFATWSVLSLRLSGQLEIRARSLPPAGFILLFTEYIQWCLVIKYEFADNAPKLRFVHSIENPEAVYDVYALIHLADDNAKSVIRNVLKSPAKLIAHRGVLVHVDRYRESGVFGPTIDTVYVHDFICQLLRDASEAMEIGFAKQVMEVGCGNGLISAGVLTHAQHLSRLVAIDIDIEAVRCTHRNLRAIKDRSLAEVYEIHGPFNSAMLRPGYDLIISNPPYIPVDPSQRRSVRGAYAEAVGGTGLLESLVREGSDLLNPGGILLLVYSDLARPELEGSVPDGMQIVDLARGNELSVLFDVEDVFEDIEWRRYLENNRGLHRERDGTYKHKILISAVSPRGDSPVGSIAKAFDRLARVRS